MAVEICVTIWYLFKIKKLNIFFPFSNFFYAFFNPPLPGIGELFYSHAFQPFNYSQRSFSRGGGAKRSPQAIHRFRPPSLSIGQLWLKVIACWDKDRTIKYANIDSLKKKTYSKKILKIFFILFYNSSSSTNGDNIFLQYFCSSRWNCNFFI